MWVELFKKLDETMHVHVRHLSQDSTFDLLPILFIAVKSSQSLQNTIKKTSQGQQVLTKTRPKTMCSHPGYKVIHLALHIMSSPIILQFGGGNMIPFKFFPFLFPKI